MASASSEQLFMYGGCVLNFNENKRQLRNEVHIYECSTESWKALPTTGTPPPGVYNCATAYSDHILYLFGGQDDTSLYASLHQLDTRSMTWTQLSPQHYRGPSRKCGCQMIYYNDSLIVIGGYAIQDSRGWTNEIHKYDIFLGKL